MLRITISRRGSPEHVLDLRDRLLRIGRGAGNEILLHDPDKTVSRNHGRIVRAGDGYVYVDHGSSNGSWVNGEIVDRVPLVDGLTISMGEYELRCEARDVASLGPDEETMLSAGRVAEGVRPGVVPGRPLEERRARAAAGLLLAATRASQAPLPLPRGADAVERHMVAHVADQPEKPAPPAPDRLDAGSEPTGPVR